jgi:hypothetical protein
LDYHGNVLRAPFGAVLFKSIARFSKFNRFEIVSEKSLKLTRDVVRGEHRTGGIIAVQYSFIFFRITMENNVLSSSYKHSICTLLLPHDVHCREKVGRKWNSTLGNSHARV